MNKKYKFRSILETDPYVACQWDYQKNGEKKPKDYSRGQNVKMWWLCDFNHSYLASIPNRVKGRGCPTCSRYLHTSKKEQLLFYYFKKLIPDVQNSYAIDKQRSIDIYSKSRKIACEYDGYPWHKKVDRDIRKDDYALSNGIDLYRIREAKCPKYQSTAKVYYIKGDIPYEEALQEVLVDLFNDICNKYGFKQTFDINVKRDYQFAVKMYYNVILNNSLAFKFPSLKEEWDIEKNEVSPEFIPSGSSHKAWWKCSLGHSWQASVSNRTNKDNQTGCPYCANKKVLPGFNDLESKKPEIAAQWDYDLNNIHPSQVNYCSDKKYYWKCNVCHHSYLYEVYRKKADYCPICNGVIVIPGFNDLATTHPIKAKEWDYEKNGTKKPTQYHANSYQKMYWICNQNSKHKFRQSIKDRTSDKLCPYCCNQIIASGVNDLQTMNPKVAKEWNYERNETTPDRISSGTSKKYWWTCNTCQYVWLASVSNRTRKNKPSGCPECAKKQRLENLSKGWILSNQNKGKKRENFVNYTYIKKKKENVKKVYEYIKANPNCRIKEIAKYMNKTDVTCLVYIKELIKEDKITFDCVKTKKYYNVR